MTRCSLLALLLVLALPALAAPPPCWTLAAPGSTVDFTGLQAGAPANGQFKQFSMHLCFDPDTAEGSLTVTVDLASVDTQNDTRDEMLRGPDFLAVNEYPNAVYRAGTIKPLGGHRYRAEGTLDLHGVSRPATVDFTFEAGHGDRRAEVRGKATLDRRDFNIGKGRWKDTRWVGATVEVQFTLALTGAKEQTARRSR